MTTCGLQNWENLVLYKWQLRTPTKDGKPTNEKTNGIFYCKHIFKKTNMTDMDNRLPLNYMLLTFDSIFQTIKKCILCHVWMDYDTNKYIMHFNFFFLFYCSLTELCVSKERYRIKVWTWLQTVYICSCLCRPSC